MHRISSAILHRKKTVVTVFTAVTLVCCLLLFAVSVNYNMVDYLPADAQSTKALAVMQEEFAGAVPNGRVMVPGVSVEEALDYKEKLAAVDGVGEVLWLDDVVDVRQPLETADRSTVEGYYKDGAALFQVTIEEGRESAAVNAIYEVIGEAGAVSGEAVDIATQQSMAVSESLRAMLILVPLILVILLVSTSSWIEPLLFLLTIGVAVLINMGTNVFFEEISFVTQAVSPILQLAVSLDYAIFLLHSFEAYRRETDDVRVAMARAMKRAFPSIAASAATTLFGFLALMFMRFELGSDLGVNLVKGIALSFVSVLVFLPALTLCCYKWIDKTRHKKLLPEFKGAGKWILKLRVPALILVALLIVPTFLAQGSNDFIYGMGSNISTSSRGGRDTAKIDETFGSSTAMVLLVPRGEPAKEELLCAELETFDHVTGVMAYANTVGAAIPPEYLSEAITEQFYSEHYARIILYTDAGNEGEEAFALVERVQSAAEAYYGEEVLSLGQSVNLYDMKDVVEKDTTVVNLIAVLAIFVVLLVTFRSVSLPLLLLLTIETSIWINLAVPYFSGDALCYIGYLVISTVQLGATVDYAILLSDHYMHNRQALGAREAMRASLGETVQSIFVSGSILAAAGFCLGIVSSDQIISELGILLGRGAVLSVLMVVLFLPAVLLLFDKLIPYTTLKANFFKGGDRK